MEKKLHDGQHRVIGQHALAGHLREQDVLPQHSGGHVSVAATVRAADSVSIGDGAAVVRTIAGTQSHGRKTLECYVYLPYTRQNGTHNPCVLRVEQLLLVTCPGKGWPDDQARIAVGILCEATVVQGRGGLCVEYNDDASTRARAVPTLLRLTQSSTRYKWAAHVHQIECPLIRASLGRTGVAGMAGVTDFVTFEKMGYHG